MADVKLNLALDSAKFGASAFPSPVGTQGTNFPAQGAFAFDGTNTERIYIKFSPVALNATATEILVTFEWYAATATSGGVSWEAALAAVTPNTDNVDWETKAFATAQAVTDTHLGTTAHRPHSVDLSLTNLDSIAEGDWAVIRISRVPGNAGDTMVGDAVLTGVRLTYLAA